MTPEGTHRLLAIGLTGLAGFVDGVGYLTLGGTFVSFMSGNTTRLGAQLGAAEPGKLGVTAVVLALFVAGVVAGHLLRRAAKGQGQMCVMAFVTLLLVVAGAVYDSGAPTLAMAAATLAMGAENATFEKNGEMHLGLTFVSSTLVKVGDHIAEALSGGAKLAWVGPLMRWTAFAAGAAMGGFAFRAVGLDALWAAALAAALFTGIASVWPATD